MPKMNGAKNLKVCQSRLQTFNRRGDKRTDHRYFEGVGGSGRVGGGPGQGGSGCDDIVDSLE